MSSQTKVIFFIFLVLLASCAPKPVDVLQKTVIPWNSANPTLAGNCFVVQDVIHSKDDVLAIVEKDTGLGADDDVPRVVYCDEVDVGMKPNQIIVQGTDKEGNQVKIFIGIGAGIMASGSDIFEDVCVNSSAQLMEKVTPKLCGLMQQPSGCDLSKFYVDTNTVAVLWKTIPITGGNTAEKGFCAYNKLPPFT